jgi:hypothetical protein
MDACDGWRGAPELDVRGTSSPPLGARAIRTRRRCVGWIPCAASPAPGVLFPKFVEDLAGLAAPVGVAPVRRPIQVAWSPCALPGTPIPATSSTNFGGRARATRPRVARRRGWPSTTPLRLRLGRARRQGLGLAARHLVGPPVVVAPGSEANSPHELSSARSSDHRFRAPVSSRRRPSTAERRSKASHVAAARARQLGRARATPVTPVTGFAAGARPARVFDRTPWPCTSERGSDVGVAAPCSTLRQRLARTSPRSGSPRACRRPRTPRAVCGWRARRRAPRRAWSARSEECDFDAHQRRLFSQPTSPRRVRTPPAAGVGGRCWRASVAHARALCAPARGARVPASKHPGGARDPDATPGAEQAPERVPMLTARTSRPCGTPLNRDGSGTH